MRLARRPTKIVLGLSALAGLAFAPSRIDEPASLRDALLTATKSAPIAVSHEATSAIPAAPALGETPPAAAGATAYAPAQGPLIEFMPLPTPLEQLGVDAAGLREAIAAYKSGDLAAGDAAARATRDDLARLTLEWVALRKLPQDAGFARLNAFHRGQPDWPAQQLQRRAEDLLFKSRDAGAALDWFARNPPQTPLGKIALARALRQHGKNEDAATLIRAVWREAELSAALEKTLTSEFADALGKAEHKARADFAAYKERDGVALRAAALAGPDVAALIRARVSVTNEGASDKLMAVVPPDLQKDAGYLFARIHKARKANKIEDAAQLMLTAPREPAALVDPDEWWTERRLIARKLLDKGDAATAYRIAAEHSASGAEQIIEAEFHAGWIALRFLSDAEKAAAHFARAARIAATPLSQSRALYWQGRAAEAQPTAEAARGFYEKAAAFPATFYGQLARAKIGEAAAKLRAAPLESTGEARAAVVRVTELLYALGEKELAALLVSDSARGLANAADLAALARVVSRDRDARVSLMLGKYAGHRGFALDELAFPVYGVPGFEPAAGSAPRSLVYSIARQESAFDARAVSHAGAKGLMQMMPATARRTAQKAGVPFDEAKLLADPSFNAQLGAAHLGDLLTENGGSYILTLAAYNAGGRRVKEWIAAYGDPRKPEVDPIDWIERIPITETRNYVQRVMENLTVYQARFTGAATALSDADLRRVHAKL